MIRYITNCKPIPCCISAEEKIKIRYKLKSGKFSHRDACPDHKNIVVKRMSICVDCGEEFFKGLKGRVGTRCDPCQKVFHGTFTREKHRVAANLRRRNEKSNKIFKTRGDYCMTAKTCKEWPCCLDCDKFYGVFRNVDPGRMEAWTI